MILVSHASLLLSLFYDTYMVLQIMGFGSLALHHMILFPILMFIGLVVQLLDNPLPVIVSFWVTTFSPSLPSAKISYLDLVPWMNIAILLMSLRKTCWIHNLILELHHSTHCHTLVYCDNISALFSSSNPVQHKRTKDIEIDLHFIRDKVATDDVRMLHVPSKSQYADIFTKNLPSSLCLDYWFSLNVCATPVRIVGGC